MPMRCESDPYIIKAIALGEAARIMISNNKSGHINLEVV
jgi:hypothetical protein